MQQDYIVFVDCILVNLDSVNAVFLRIALLDGLARQLSRLAAKYNACTQLDSEGRRHYETAAFDTHNLGDAFVFVHLIHFFIDFLETLRALKHRCNVPEIYALDRPVRDATQVVQ